MASTNVTDVTSVLNANVYLNFLPKDSAVHFEVARNLYLATLGALLWDILSSFPEDFTLLKSGFRLSLIPYFLSRLAAFGFTSLSVVAKTHPILHCKAFEYGAMACWIIASACSSLLLDKRIYDLYRHSNPIRIFFLILLCATVGISLVAPVGHRMEPLPPTNYCIDMGLKHFAVAAIFARLVSDLCVFIGISHCIVTMKEVSGDRYTWRGVLTGKSTSRLFRAFLQGGQQFYFILVLSNLLVAVLVVTPSVPIFYQIMFTVPDIALSTTFACRVYRNTKLAANKTNTVMDDIFLKPVPRRQDSKNLEAAESGFNINAAGNPHRASTLPFPAIRTPLRSFSTPSRLQPLPPHIPPREERRSVVKDVPIITVHRSGTSRLDCIVQTKGAFLV